ncbi:pentapeptide repeat-containing protein [Alkalicoccobacillus gibsonii]|uniref:pentapeptide repeat-containing protein n=1 Tax=Alkalicoccobacillus gibsonii TaxID=79881 RepID=UPI001FECEB45|nr:pentapeptide repeat-containing protein [Alkalicoccobacillus gibsonii]
MVIQMMTITELKSDCSQCFGLCCVALPYLKSTDFAKDKAGGVPCHNLNEHYMCTIHSNLREEGYKGCTVYECFGAGQKVSQTIYKNVSWHEKSSEEMFEVFPIIQQLQEMLAYLDEALKREETKPIHTQLMKAFNKIDAYTYKDPETILTLDLTVIRSEISDYLSEAGELVAYAKANEPRIQRAAFEFMGAQLKRHNFKGAKLRGVFFIAADLRGANFTSAELLGADFRDADVCGADFTGALFLTQAQMNAAIGNEATILPKHLQQPSHWV